MRLDKVLAHMGFGSRKNVREILRRGKVTVNEKIIRQHGFKVDPYEDCIAVEGEEIHYREFIYIMLNKPQGYISATVDGYHQTVIDLLSEDLRHFNPFPVGRLDLDTEGLLLLTNDGKLAHALTSPKRGIKKTYYAKIEGRIQEDIVPLFQKGICLEDGYQTKPAQLNILKRGKVTDIELTITEGKYHQVKRMFKALGYNVLYLKRLQMGKIVLDENLPVGAYRELTEGELAYCRSVK